MKAYELINYLEKLIPPTCASDWDNVGLLAGRYNKEVNKVYVALDATDEVIVDAVRRGCDFLLTHHPLIFKPIKRITEDDFIGRRLLTLIGNDISYYAMHTNFDAAPNGMADLAAILLGLQYGTPMEVMSDELETPWGIGKVGNLEQVCTLADLCQRVKQRFQLETLNVYPARGFENPVRRVAICPGSGRSMIDAALKSGAEVLITGDIGHHEGIDAQAQGLTIIDGGHFGLEKIFIPVMANQIKEVFPKLEVYTASAKSPCRIV
ncbi:UPF0135 protein Bsu YqfO [Lachnospiraceae bacterium TWA4]|nr:UPF0135 protein Bsu YqfO [Lachnospiraceae bacterium TWA4]